MEAQNPQTVCYRCASSWSLWRDGGPSNFDTMRGVWFYKLTVSIRPSGIRLATLILRQCEVTMWTSVSLVTAYPVKRKATYPRDSIRYSISSVSKVLSNLGICSHLYGNG
ncbi:hypothetical protein BS17DRAFT_547027 [Gyrodon lividus]|nr:hypothetical protein BS17DRAFT_547027 [Gyrodon lividus]